MAVIVKIMGGLGNQMFQYAAGRALAMRLDTELKFDTSWFVFQKNDTPRTFMLQAFSIAAIKASSEDINSIIYKKQSFFEKVKCVKQYSSSYIAEPSYEYWSDFSSIANPVYLMGYWQNEQYFSNIAHIIKKDFAFSEFSCTDAKNIANKIKSSFCSVSIHIRRGDYVENPITKQYHGVCTPEYYKKALQIITEKYNNSPELFIFSDDPEWVKNNFDTRGCRSVIIDIPQHKDAPYHDMHLMSLCRHHIIANSSFSWWGAWLSTGDGIVVAPKYWFAEETMKNFNPSLPSWIKII